jgi:CheY-like chemotaxis protein
VRCGELDAASRCCDRARELTQQLLTFSTGGDPVRSPTALLPLVQESADFALRGSNLRYTCMSEDDLWLVNVDPAHMRQVVHHIVLNARDAMPEGGSLRIRLENDDVDDPTSLPLPPGRYVKLSIRDRGPGILAKDRTRVFEPYFSTHEGHTGLGLTICHSILVKHGGFITLDSKRGVGTTAIVYLPAMAAPELSLPMAIEDERPGSCGGRVLVMDDEPLVRETLCAVLELLGYESEGVHDGATALARYDEAAGEGHRFDVVIMDLTVPGGMGGKEAVRHLKARDPAAIAVVSSGYSADPVLARFQDFQFDGMIAKPFTIEQLGTLLGNLLPSPNTLKR